MQNQLFDLQSGDSLCLGGYRITLLEIGDGCAVFEIEGPDGSVQVEPVSFGSMDLADQEAVLAC